MKYTKKETSTEEKLSKKSWNTWKKKTTKEDTQEDWQEEKK